MAVNKGLKSLANSTPNFSNQALENAINDIKAIDNDDGYQFIKSQFDVDTAIHDNTVLTTSQKNDALETLYAAQPHLQIGLYLRNTVRHTNTILDGTILGFNETIGNFPQGSFLEIMQLTLGLQGLIPSIYGVPASEKRRSVNDHLGILNNMFTTTEDSSAPVFTRLTRMMTLIRDTATAGGGSSALAIGTAAVRFSNNALVTFLNSVVADSTDFQTSLDNAVSQAAGNYSSLNTRISDALAGDPITELQAIRDTIVTQQELEEANITSLRDYSETVSKNLAFASLAEDTDLRQLMSRVAQNENWKSYFDTYELNQGYLNSALDTDTDSDKSSVIDSVLTDLGLPDVLDSTNLQAVADKAKRDDRIDTTNYDRFTVQQQIIKSCEQLLITTANIDILSLSASLLNNMNQHDRDKIAEQLDLNESANTLS
tara:strand:- start:1974 stop:3260 length:1287 start_codon:yes stop_codon:yes gene_type:complete